MDKRKADNFHISRSKFFRQAASNEYRREKTIPPPRILVKKCIERWIIWSEKKEGENNINERSNN